MRHMGPFELSGILVAPSALLAEPSSWRANLATRRTWRITAIQWLPFCLARESRGMLFSGLLGVEPTSALGRAHFASCGPISIFVWACATLSLATIGRH